MEQIRYQHKLSFSVCSLLKFSRSSYHVNPFSGIGKTTLIRKVVENLKNSKEPFMITGFFTEELRQDGIRKGFDVVTLDDKRSVLSRKRYFTLIDLF